MQGAANANLRHRRLAHLNRKSLGLLKSPGNNTVCFHGPVPGFGVCVVRKSRYLAFPEVADHNIKLPFQLVFADLMLPLTPEARGGYTYVSEIPDKRTPSGRRLSS